LQAGLPPESIPETTVFVMIGTKMNDIEVKPMRQLIKLIDKTI
jgi:hypothetical protein